jgi:hypothetical protein
MSIWLPQDKFEEMIAKSSSYKAATIVKHTAESETMLSKLFKDCAKESETAIFNAHLLKLVPSLVQVQLPIDHCKELVVKKDHHRLRDKVNIFGLAHDMPLFRAVLEDQMNERALELLSIKSEDAAEDLESRKAPKYFEEIGDIFHSYFGKTIEQSGDDEVNYKQEFIDDCTFRIYDNCEQTFPRKPLYFYTSEDLRDQILAEYKKELF